MTNDAWHLSISSSSDPGCCICHLDRNCSIKTPLYSTPLTASFCCRVKNDWFPCPSTSLRMCENGSADYQGPGFSHHCFAPSLTGRAVSVLTLRQTWPSACWHDLPLRPEPARWTAVDAGPRSIASLKTKHQQYIMKGRFTSCLSKLNTHDIWKAQTLFLRRCTFGVCERVTLVIYR